MTLTFLGVEESRSTISVGDRESARSGSPIRWPSVLRIAYRTRRKVAEFTWVLFLERGRKKGDERSYG